MSTHTHKTSMQKYVIIGLLLALLVTIGLLVNANRSQQNTQSDASSAVNNYGQSLTEPAGSVDGIEQPMIDALNSL